jgi:PPOX class probable F420-dependent enzyme
VAPPAIDAAARRFLLRQRVGHLATAAADAVPHVVPFCFALDGDDLYFVIDAKPKREHGAALKRMRNIAANPRVAVVVDEYDDDWSRLAYVLLHGEAAVVDGEAERAAALRLLRARYPQYVTMDLEGEAHPVVRVRVERVHHWRASG